MSFDEKPYEDMTDSERSRYEEEHFDRLTSEQKFHVADRAFNNGQPLTVEKAAIMDHAYGNGDGIFDNKDRELIEEKRNDLGLLKYFGQAAGAMFDAAVLSQNLASFQLGPQGSGFLGGLFNSSSNNIPASFQPVITAQAPSAGMAGGQTAPAPKSIFDWMP